jgi:alanyl-tRNA synthetase
MEILCTKKLFILDPYLKEFEATVLKTTTNHVLLDRTCFYPESGGQAGDTGYLGQSGVIDTQYDSDRKTIIHIIEGKYTFEEGEKVCGRIDWDRRYKIMKLHAASHVVEYFLFKVFGSLKLVGTHVNERHDSSTYEYPDTFSPQKIEEVNRLANEYISKGYVIERWTDKKNSNYLYWKAGEIEVPCCGTHPKSLAEVGPIRIKRETGGRNREKVITKSLDLS